MLLVHSVRDNVGRVSQLYVLSYVSRISLARIKTYFVLIFADIHKLLRTETVGII